MSLVTAVKGIISNLYPDATCILSSKFQANVQALITELSALPLIVIDDELPKTGSIQKNNNVLKDTKIVISFLDLDSTDNTDEQSEAIVEAMEALADRVAVRIYQLLEVRPSGNQKYKVTPMYHVFTSNMSGMALEMQVNYNSIINFSSNGYSADTLLQSVDTEQYKSDYTN